MDIKAVIIGSGRVATGFSRFLRTRGIEVTGFVTSSEQRAKQVSAEIGLPGYTRLADALAVANRPNTAVICNANHQHASSCIEALGCDLHVYCEKPMAVTFAECEAMVAAERKSKGSLQIGFEYIHSTMPRRLLELQRDDFFGEILLASCVDSRGHWWSGDPDAPFSEQGKLRRDLGGGIIFHCGIHQLDMLRAFMGEFAEVISFRSARNALPYYPADVPDHVQVMCKQSNGALASLEVFHNRAPTYYRRVPSYQPNWSNVPGHEFRLSLIGTRGSCLADFYGEKIHLFQFHHAIKDTELLRTEDFAHHPGNELHHDMNGFLQRYLDNLRDGKGPLTPASDALETMRLAFAAEESIVTGQPVRIEKLPG
jgi:predicted dehydrogenase